MKRLTFIKAITLALLFLTTHTSQAENFKPSTFNWNNLTNNRE